MNVPTKRTFGRLLSHRNVPTDNASSVEDDCHEKAKKARLQQQEPENIRRLTLRLNEAVLPFKKQTTCALEAIRNFRDVDKENVVEIADENALLDYTAGQVDERVSMPRPPPAKTPNPPPPSVPQQEQSVATPDHAAEAPKGLSRKCRVARNRKGLLFFFLNTLLILHSWDTFFMPFSLVAHVG